MTIGLDRLLTASQMDGEHLLFAVERRVWIAIAHNIKSQPFLIYKRLLVVLIRLILDAVFSTPSSDYENTTLFTWRYVTIPETDL